MSTDPREGARGQDAAPKAKLIAIGGFLGAGKTELIIQLAKALTSEENKRVAIVTNDQGEQLVDSRIVEEYGFDFAEVLRGCFCCRFPVLISRLHDIIREIKPHVILTEPVGSCTDLISTVYLPLRKFHKDKIILAPHIALTDASTILDIDKELGITFPRTKQGHLMSWQLREADVVGINKIDLVSSEHINKVERLVRGINDRAEIIRFSARTGSNVDRVMRMILDEESPLCSSVEVDYDIYAAAEAELGWFNGGWSINARERFEPQGLIEGLLISTAKMIEERKGRVCHIKIYCSTDQGAVKGSLVTVQQGVQFTGQMVPPTTAADVTVNIRAALAPEEITESVNGVLASESAARNAKYTKWHSQSFRPGFPVPFCKLKAGVGGEEE